MEAELVVEGNIVNAMFTDEVMSMDAELVIKAWFWRES